MENTAKKAVQDTAILQDDWQIAENHENQSHEKTNGAEVDLRSAEASGYGTDAEDDILHVSNNDRNDNDDDDDDDDDDDNPKEDWGDIDPQHHPHPFPDSNDPSGPGSAV